jgi:hypothetical protein
VAGKGRAKKARNSIPKKRILLPPQRARASAEMLAALGRREILLLVPIIQD